MAIVGIADLRVSEIVNVAVTATNPREMKIARPDIIFPRKYVDRIDTRLVSLQEHGASEVKDWHDRYRQGSGDNHQGGGPRCGPVEHP